MPDYPDPFKVMPARAVWPTAGRSGWVIAWRQTKLQPGYFVPTECNTFLTEADAIREANKEVRLAHKYGLESP